jgi:hypothetical protein
MARRPGAGRPRSANPQPGSTAVPIKIDGAARPADPVQPEIIAVAAVAPLAPDFTPRMLRTQAAYRQLITSGISSADAAGLIGYVLGLPQCESRWSLNQINCFLFLRSMYGGSKWGEAERQAE